MSAQLLSIRTAPNTPMPALPVAVSHPIHAALRQLAAQQADTLATDFIDRLDGALQGLTAEARNVSETRAALALGDAMAMSRGTLLRRFTQSFLNRFDPLQPISRAALVDLDRLCVLPSEELEETIALAHLAQQAERLAGEAGRQLQARLTWAARDLSLPALAAAFAPSAIGDSFAAAFRAIELTAAQRVLAYRVVESHALPQWTGVLDAALQLLDQHGLRFPRAATAAAVAATPVTAEITTQCLREIAVSRATGGDAPLALELLRHVEHSGPATAAIALAGRWIDALLAEPQLPAALLPDLEALRFPVIKAAVSDHSFFVNIAHPVRRMINDLAERAALAGPQGLPLAPLRLELRELSDRINISAAFAHDLLPRSVPLDASEMDRFDEQHGSEQLARRDALLMKVRCLVVRELDAQTLGASLPSEAAAVLSGGFLPLLAVTLLNHGAGSAEDRCVRALLDRFVGSFTPGIGEPARELVIDALCSRLLDLGLREDRVSRLMSGIERAYLHANMPTEADTGESRFDNASDEIAAILTALERPQPVAIAAPAVAASAPLFAAAANESPALTHAEENPIPIVLQAEHWFRVHDPRSGDDRWLCLSAYYPAQDSLSFRSFDGTSVLGLRASQFIEDLIAGRAEPLNPEPPVERAMKALRARAVPQAVPRLAVAG